MHIETRRDYSPDPTMDPIQAIFYHLFSDTPALDGSLIEETGCFILDKNLTILNSQTCQDSSKSGVLVDPCIQSQGHESSCQISSQSGTGKEDGATAHHSKLLSNAGFISGSCRYHSDEIDMIKGFSDWLKQIDPDMLLGYEVQMLSWGYFIERAGALGINILPLISRVGEKEKAKTKDSNSEPSELWFGQLTDIALTGRILLNVWRIMRSEVSLGFCKNNCCLWSKFFFRYCIVCYVKLTRSLWGKYLFNT